MQIYLNRALATFFFPMGLITASFIFLGHKRGLRRQLVVWPAGLALSFGLCLLFHWLKDLAFSSQKSGDTSEIYFSTLEQFLMNYGLNVLIRLILFLVYIRLIGLAYRAERKEAVYFACTATAAETLATLLFQILVVRYGPESAYVMRIITANPGNLLLYIGLHALVYILCWWFFARRLPMEYVADLPARLLTVAVLVTVAVIFSSCVTAPPTESEYMSHLVLLITQFILCLTILLLEYFMVSWYSSRFEQAQLATLMRYQEKHYVVTRERMDAVNRTAHDMNYKLRSVMRELESGGAGEAMRELSEIGEAIQAWDALYHTGSGALDAVLSEKAAQCAQEGIQFSVIADGTSAGLLSDTDIYTLFGNALDNAIEAVRKVEDPADRLISLSLRKNRGFLLFHIENSFRGEVRFRDGEPVTSKEDRFSHGFGVKSIRSIAGKYGGRVTLSAREQVFSLDVVLPPGRTETV